MGVVAMYNLGQVTLAGLYFTNTDHAAAGHDIAGVAAIGSFGMVNAQVWGAKIDGVVDSLIFGQVDGKVVGLTLTGQVISTKLDEGVATTLSLRDDSGVFYGFKAAYAMNNFSVSGAFIKNDADQPVHALAGDDDTGVIAVGWRIQNDYKTAGGTAAETAYGIDVGATFGKFGLGLGYAIAKNTGLVNTGVENDVKEIYGSVKYSYAPNFYTLVKVGDVNSDTAADDDKLFYFEAKYSF
jgi:hypothetical protein